ncbi:MAG: hypothetical protein HY316_06265 [Acidobacteria bacterium]|nr:hypothetical protein [Acidobacteriota bacterium]
MRIGTRERASPRASPVVCQLARGWVVFGCAAFLTAMLTGCLVRSRTKLPPAPLVPAWQHATLAELLEKVQKQQDAIQTLEATVQIEPSVSFAQKGEIVTYRDVRAFLLIRKPAFLRMIGQYPVVRNTAFDLASDGDEFGLFIPSKNRYITGDSRGGKRSKSALENLRPQHILDALLVEGPEPGREDAALEVATEGQKSYYIVLILRREPSGQLLLAQKLWYEREQLSLARLQIFDATGEMATDARYSAYSEFAGVSYPQQIILNRPLDDYGLMLTVTQLKFNEPISDDKFQMAQPSGAEVVDLERTSS